MDEWTDDAHRHDHSRHTLADSSSTEVADYVADMTAELARVSRGSGLDLIAYLLDIVHLEAKTTSRKETTTGH